jgi:hypothetical protein
MMVVHRSAMGGAACGSQLCSRGDCTSATKFFTEADDNIAIAAIPSGHIVYSLLKVSIQTILYLQSLCNPQSLLGKRRFGLAGDHPTGQEGAGMGAAGGVLSLHLLLVSRAKAKVPP